MTTNIVYANTADGYLQSINASYATALAGSGFIVENTGNATYWGQNNNAGTYTVLQSFIDFTYTPVSTESITSAFIRVQASVNLSTGVSRDLVFSEFDWGGTLTTADWRTTTQLNALPTIATITNAEDAGTKYLLGGSDALVTRLASAGPLRLVCASSRQRAGTTPTSDEGSAFWSADFSGTESDPALVFTSAPISRLLGVLGSQVQLSDGTHAYLELSSETPTSGTLTLKHHNGTSASTIATVPTAASGSQNAFALTRFGSQSFALVTDASDNLYVIGQRSSGSGSPGANILAAKAYTKGVGYNWTAVTYSGGFNIATASMPSYTDGCLNNFAAAWHNVGTNGTIMTVASHASGQTPNTTGDIVYALLNCQSLLVGSGTLFRNSGSARGVVVNSTTDSNDYTTFANETGTSIDVVAAPGTNDRGYVITPGPYMAPGDNDIVYTYRYILASNGTSIIDNDAASAGYGNKDAAAKTRVIGIDGTTYITVAGDSDTNFGLTARIRQNSGTSSTFTTLGSITLDSSGPASMPTASTLATSQAWDAVYDPSGECLWIYYLDAANQNRLLRTSIDMNTYLAAADEVQVSAAIGAVGSTNYAIRVHRGETQGQQVLVSVASKTSGGTHSTVYITDTLNLAPNAPTLTPKSNFDATASAVFNWTFSDPNAGDTQSAYEFEVVDVSDGSLDIDTGKVTSTTASRTVTGSTLANSKSYQWRVKTWDQLDAEGAWSAYSSFSTSAGGTVTITDPASDNPAGVITDNYVITWSVSGTTQAAYRVKLIRTDTSATLSDTGWVSSVATSLDVTGMITDVEHRIEVTVRNAGLVESGTGTRLITPSFGTPEKPTFTTSVMTDHILISVNNPTPTGDKPEVTENQILRRVNGSADDYSLVGSTTVDGTFKDYTAASGVTFQYIVRGVA